MDIADLMNTHIQFKVRGSQRNLYPGTMPIWSMVKGITDNKNLANTTKELRSLPIEEYKKQKARRLMAVYLGVRFRDTKGKATKENVSKYTGIAGYDFDNVDVIVTLLKLQSIPEVFCAGLSASGSGVWCACKINAATSKEFALCFAKGIGAFREAGIVGIDIGAHDPTRARFVAHDPNFWWRWDALDDIPGFDPDGDLLLLGKPKKNKNHNVNLLPEGYQPSPEVCYDMAREIVSVAAETPDGERNNAKAYMCGRLKWLANRAKVPASTYAPLFIEAWDAVGSTHSKTVSMATRLLING